MTRKLYGSILLYGGVPHFAYKVFNDTNQPCFELTTRLSVEDVMRANTTVIEPLDWSMHRKEMVAPKPFLTIEDTLFPDIRIYKMWETQNDTETNG
jgi:hypothetical protein